MRTDKGIDLPPQKGATKPKHPIPQPPLAVPEHGRGSVVQSPPRLTSTRFTFLFVSTDSTGTSNSRCMKLNSSKYIFVYLGGGVVYGLHVLLTAPVIAGAQGLKGVPPFCIFMVLKLS